jgi:two-component system, chemotaxis family, protein-glutamate methylesterase/glutaminase
MGPNHQKIRVLVVDDSVIIRRIISRMIEEDDALELVGNARNGVQAIEKIDQLRPDVVTMDIEMPEMDGIEALRLVRNKYPDLRVIMFSTLTDHGASATVESLMLGASDYVTKPTNEGHEAETIASIRSQLLPKIKQFFVSSFPKQAARKPELFSRTPASQAIRGWRAPQAVLIGISTGGPTALAELLPAFPGDFPLPILIVQHMPPLFTRLLAERLNSRSSLHVIEAREGLAVVPGTAILAAGGYHMQLIRSDGQVRVMMNHGPLENFCRPSVDVLFRSAREVFGGALIAAILTGMGQDGLQGSSLLKEEGAYLIAQDKASSVVWGMPGAVVGAGLADQVLSVKEIVPAILRRVGRP